MSTTLAEERSIRDYPPPVRVESPIQLVQGWYYVVVGVWVAVGLTTLQLTTQPIIDIAHLWIVRCIGVLLVCAGVGLIRVSRFKETTTLATSGPVIVAVLLSLLEVVAFLNDVIPATFFLDTGMECGFFGWWMIAFYYSNKLERLSGSGTQSNSTK